MSIQDRTYSDVLEQLERLRSVPMRDPIAAARGRAQFLALAESLRRGVSPGPVQRLKGWLESVTIQTKERHPLATPLAAVLLALAICLGGAGATAYAAQGALPGDALYPVKTSIEEARVALSPDEATEGQLRLEFAQERMEETLALIAQGRYGDIQVAADRLETEIEQASEVCDALAQDDPKHARTLSESLDTALAQYVQVLSNLLGTVPAEARPAISRALKVSQSNREWARQKARERLPRRRDRVPTRPTIPPESTIPVKPTLPVKPPVVPPGPPDHAPRGKPDDVPLGPPDRAPRGKPDDVSAEPVIPVRPTIPVKLSIVPPGPPDHAPRGKPDDVPRGRPDDAPTKPVVPVKPAVPVKPTAVRPSRPDHAPRAKPNDVPLGPPEHAPRGLSP